MGKLFGLFITLLFSSCMTLNNALNKVVSTDDFSKPQEKLLAAKCEEQFPYTEGVTPGTEKVNDSAFNVFKRMSAETLEQANINYNNLAKFTDSTYRASKEYKALLEQARASRDSAAGVVKALKKGIPCPEILITDTARRKGGPVQAALEIAVNQLKLEVAANEIKIQDKTIETDKLKGELKEAKDARWNLFWIGLGIGAGVVAIGGFILKFKKII